MNHLTNSSLASQDAHSTAFFHPVKHLVFDRLFIQQLSLKPIYQTTNLTSNSKHSQLQLAVLQQLIR
jgi:hypothetical protein